MSEAKEWCWQWPIKGRTPDQVFDFVAERITSPYELVPPPFSYPGTELDLDPRLFKLVCEAMPAQLNNLGIHTLGDFVDGRFIPSRGEGGFEGVHEIERWAILTIASVLGGNAEPVDGVFCNGGTDANLLGLWMGRQWLRRKIQAPVPGVVLFKTELTHYSIAKAADILDIEPACQVNVGLNRFGQMDPADLERRIWEWAKLGYSRFLVVPTVGTTLTGSVDPIDDISQVAERASLSQDPRMRVYVHVDAAFGGFTVPFVAPSIPIGFQNQAVCSLTVDCHKMGQLPYPGGVFLCRAGWFKTLERAVHYVDGHQFDTVLGSRPALPAVIAWLTYQSIGFEGQRLYVQQCLDGKERLRQALLAQVPVAESLRHDTPFWILPSSPYVNILPLGLNRPEDEVRHLFKSAELSPYELRSENLPAVMRPTGVAAATACKVVVMPHTLPFLERFALDLTSALKR